MAEGKIKRLLRRTHLTVFDADDRSVDALARAMKMKGFKIPRRR